MELELKPGDKVELIDDHWKFPQDKHVPREYANVTLPVKDEPYTVRENIETEIGRGIRLEEIVNKKIWHDRGGWQEPCFSPKKFRKR